MPPQAPSRIELSAAALGRNVRFLRRLVGPEVIFCAVVKGNAYGHGIASFVPLAEQCGVRHFAVFSPDEAEALLRVRRAQSRVIVMGPLFEDATDWAVAHGVELFVFDRGTLGRALAAAARRGRPARVHLELETGLHRTGLEGAELAAAVEDLRAAGPRVALEGVCTHYAGAESVGNYLRIHHQIQRFREAVEHLRALGVDPGLRHTACSAAAITYPETRMDMVRFGIAQYGFWPSKETRMSYLMGLGDSALAAPDPLQRVLTWKSAVMSVKPVGPGEFLGYGTSYLTDRPQIVAAVPVGYALGFARALSNVGRVLVRGHRVGVVGLVNMSMMLLDVTEVPGVAVGDEVVLIGSQDQHTITVASFSDLAGQINYEMLVRLHPSIPREVVA